MTSRQKLTRRDFLKLLWNGFVGSALLSAGGVGYGALVEPGSFSVESVELNLNRLPKSFSGVRIAQISDIHMGGWMNRERFQQVADLIAAEKPDVLLITGDFLLGNHLPDEILRKAIDDLTDVLSPLAESIPSFAVLGNHDYWVDPAMVRKMLAASNVMELLNTVFPLTRGSDKLYLCGVDDVWEGTVRLNDILARLDGDSPAILLAHEPDYADTSAATGRFDLQISGHTHGGQVAIPWLGPPVLPYLGQKYPSGLYKVQDMFQYTNRGVGMSRLAF
ncbi:MAG TPA: metallophosphoesterase, partial [Anaerolineales bacterium]|nr:metallophosphoesterase [Anaerolineales bacterium]